MSKGAFVAYYRVSTAKQGASGLGLEAQRRSVLDYLNGSKWTIAAEFTEIESGKRDDRPELAKAFAACRLYGAKLVIAKLDRLSRDAHFLLGLQKADVQFVAADMPEANEMIVGIMAVVAQAERKMISVRTRSALAAAKARGTKLGGYRGSPITPEAARSGIEFRQARAAARAAELASVIGDLRSAGVTSLGKLASSLTDRGIPTARGGSVWTAMQVSRVLERLSLRGRAD